MTAEAVGLPRLSRRDDRMPPPIAHLSDEEVVALVARSDEAALAELYDRFGAVAYGLAVRVLRDRSLAQDAVQEAFLAAWRTAPSFDPRRAKAQTWLLTLVHRRSVDVVRREERRRADPLDSAPVPTGEATDEAAWVRERRREVQGALGQLPPDQRQVLELAYYGGLSQSELAERLGVPLGTIKSRMFAGLSKLRDLLADDEGGR
jgi:RNA polymerase sigma factor (sigma-70 family)